MSLTLGEQAAGLPKMTTRNVSGVPPLLYRRQQRDATQTALPQSAASVLVSGDLLTHFLHVDDEQRGAQAGTAEQSVGVRHPVFALVPVRAKHAKKEAGALRWCSGCAAVCERSAATCPLAPPGTAAFLPDHSLYPAE